MATQRGGNAGWSGHRTASERASESHTEFNERMLGWKPTATLAANMSARSAAAGGPTVPATAAAAASGANAFSQASTGPQTGQVLSITRSEVLGATVTTMKVLLAKGGERTVTADAKNGTTRIDEDVMEGDHVRFTATGPQMWEWKKIVAASEKVRKRKRVFDTDALLGPHGLEKLYEQFHTLKWDTRPLCESKALTQIVRMYKEWAFNLWPKLSFPLLVNRVEKMGSKAAVKELVLDMRYGKEIDWEDVRLEQEEGAEAYAARRKAKQVALSENAAGIFNAFAASLQPGIRQAKPDGSWEDRRDAAQGGGAAGGEEDVNDDDFDALFAKYGANAAAASAGKPSAKDQAKMGASEDAQAAVDRRMREAEEDGGEIQIGGSAANMWSAASSKVAAAAKSAAAAAAQAAEDEEAVHSRRPAKRRRAAADDSDDEQEYEFAPLPTPSSSAAAGSSDSQQADGAPEAAASAEGEPSVPAAAAPTESGAEGQPQSADSSSINIPATEEEGSASTDAPAPVSELVRADTSTQMLDAPTAAAAAVPAEPQETAAAPEVEVSIEPPTLSLPLEPSQSAEGSGEAQEDQQGEVDAEAMADFLADDEGETAALVASQQPPTAEESAHTASEQLPANEPMDTAGEAAVQPPVQASLEATQVL